MDPKPTPATARDTCDLVLTIRGDRDRVRPIGGGAGRAWRLRKLGADAVHRVAEGPGGPTCDCGDQVRRHRGDGSACKHIRALAALGLLD